MKKIFMFPGQGSQKTGMGEGLFEEFTDTVDACQEILNEKHEERGAYSIIDICSSPEKVDLLNRTDFTQPLLYLVNALHYLKSVQSGEDGDIFIGHSLGEYNALHAGGGFDLLTGFRLVMKRGELMNQSREGRMVAILGLEEEVIEKIISQYRESKSPVEVANYNSPGQVIISGAATTLNSTLENIFKEAGAKKVIWLPVSGAFHSSLMKPAAAQFETYLQKFPFSSLQKPVYSNTTTLLYPSDATNIPHTLTRQIYSPVRWMEEIIQVHHDYPEAQFTEIGPGQVLTGLVKRIL